MHVEGEKGCNVTWFPSKLPAKEELRPRCEKLLGDARMEGMIVDTGSFGWGYEAAWMKWPAINAVSLFRQKFPGGDRFSCLLGYASFADETRPAEPAR